MPQPVKKTKSNRKVD
ncbi:hypothetical protein [Mesorhizobium sp.]